MTYRRIAAGTLVAVLLLLVIAFALREAGDFERISGVARSAGSADEATLRGTGAQDAPREDPVEQDLLGEGSASPPRASGPWIVRGRVVDLLHRPVDGVSIDLETPGTDGPASGADGTFTWQTERESVTLRPSGDWDGSVVATRAKPEVVLQVIRLLPLDVLVLDAAGRPVAGIVGRIAHFYIGGSEPNGGQTWCEDHSPFGPTDAHGRCELTLAAATQSLTLEVTQEDASASEDVAFPYEREITLRLRPRLWIRGEVVDRAGRRLEPEGRLVARPLDPTRATIGDEDVLWIEADLDDVASGEAASEGEKPERPPRPFFLQVSGAGPWFVHFDPDAEGLADSDPVLVTAPADGVRLVCLPAVSIRGRVLDLPPVDFEARWIPASAPDPGRRPPAHAQVGPDGTFALHGLAPGPGRLFVRCGYDDRFALLENVQAPLEDVRVRLVEGLSLGGRVEDAGPPADGIDAWLWILAEDDGLRAPATVQPDGTWRIRGLPPGRYELSWRWHGRWGQSSGRWVPFGVSVDLGPETGEVVLPAPR